MKFDNRISSDVILQHQRHTLRSAHKRGQFFSNIHATEAKGFGNRKPPKRGASRCTAW